MTMRMILMLAALLCLCMSSVRAEAPWMPTAPGATWTYAVTGGKGPVVVKMGQKAASGAWDLQWDKTPGLAKVTPGAVLLSEQRHVGVAGRPTMIAKADLRFDGAATWKMNTCSGCMVYDMTCAREGTEAVDVPAGHYECMKFVLDGGGAKETWWIARGVGIVKYQATYPRQTVTWALQKFERGR